MAFTPSLFSFFVLLTACSFFACTNNTDTTPASTVQLVECPPNKNKTAYQNAALQNYTYTRGKMMFNPQNIRLGGQSVSNVPRSTAKTNKGIHLHLSTNHKQHHLSNNNIFEYPLENGEYDLFAFMADSYYESIKVPDAIMGRHIEVRNGALAASRPIEQVALIYNMPIGTQEISETDSILFDFVLYGTELKEKGNHVMLTINEQAPVRIDKWQAYYLTGFTEGEYKLVLTLNNAQGKTITPSVDYTFIVENPAKELK